MTVLLSYLGLAWPRLLLYPGGLCALALVWLLRRVRRLEPTNAPLELQVVGCVPPLLLLCLLPLPGAVALPRSIDLPTALALLEWPAALALAAKVSAEDSEPEARVRLLALRYSLLLLAVVTLTLGSRSLALDALVREPPSGLLPRALLASGAAAWALALPPLLALGPFAEDASAQSWGDELRVIGHALLAALPWLGLLPSPLLAPLPPLVIGLLLFSADRGGPRLRFVWLMLLRACALGLAALILAAAGLSLFERLR